MSDQTRRLGRLFLSSREYFNLDQDGCQGTRRVQEMTWEVGLSGRLEFAQIELDRV